MQTSCWCGLGKSQKQNCPGPPGLTGHLVRAGSCCLPLRAEQRGLGQRLGLRCTREVEVQGWRGPWEIPGDRRGPAAQEGERWPPPGLHFTDTRWTWLSVGSGERVRAGARGSPEMVLLAPEEEMGGRDRDGLRGRRRQLASWRPPCPPPHWEVTNPPPQQSARWRVGEGRTEAVGARGVLQAESKAPAGREGS